MVHTGRQVCLGIAAVVYRNRMAPRRQATHYIRPNEPCSADHEHMHALTSLTPVLTNSDFVVVRHNLRNYALSVFSRQLYCGRTPLMTTLHFAFDNFVDSKRHRRFAQPGPKTFSVQAVTIGGRGRLALPRLTRICAQPFCRLDCLISSFSPQVSPPRWSGCAKIAHLPEGARGNTSSIAANAQGIWIKSFFLYRCFFACDGIIGGGVTSAHRRNPGSCE